VRPTDVRCDSSLMNNSSRSLEFKAAMANALAPVVFFDEVTRGIYSTDASHYQIMPCAVLIPEDEDQVVTAIRIAAQHHIPVTARGAGTSLSGQTHGEGVVIDLSKHFDKVLEVNLEEGWARVEPGVVRDQLNAAVACHGLQYAPDPATSNRATIAGMIGNNSAGMYSVVYGKTSDHLLGCRVALSGGEVLEFAPVTRAAWGDGAQGRLLKGLDAIVTPRRDEIEQRYPKVMRSVSGYALNQFLGDPEKEPWDLSQLICGSEGTLGVLLEARVKLVPLPLSKALCVVHFESLQDSLRAVAPLLAFGPAAIELLDHVVLDEAVRNPSTRHLTSFIEGTPRAVLMVEFHGDTSVALEAKLAEVRAYMGEHKIGYAAPLFLDAASQARVWDVRRLGLGLITNTPGPTKGMAFVEDACIPLPHLAEYIDRMLALCASESVNVSVYAHASVGVLHVRPMLDLHLAKDIAKMKRIANAAFEMVVGYGGAWSGEHGDGLVRGEFIERFFGSELVQAFREVKQLFDPVGIMNPNKLIDPPGMTEHMRYGVADYSARTKAADRITHFGFRSQGGLSGAVEQCNGVGACRKLDDGVMCPSYMATRNEQDSTRGRANALRLAISGQLSAESDPARAMASQPIQDVMKYCLSCKACKNECPNSVDVAKMKSEALQQHHEVHGAPLGARIIAIMPSIGERFTGAWSGLINAVQRLGFSRRLLQRIAGLDARRVAPAFARRSLRRQWAGRPQPEQADVVLYVDSYTNMYEPHLGLAAVALLDAAGLKTEVAFAGDSQRARISKGFLNDAKRHGTKVMEALDRAGRPETPILCLEPSCASSLADDLPDLIDDSALGARIAERVCLIEGLLLKLEIEVESTTPKLLVHGHCHQKAVFDMRDLTRLLPHADLIDAGCCGMAGSFGYEHYEISQAVANSRLFPALERRDPECVVVANGLSCRHQIHDRFGFMPKHMVEVIQPKA